MHGHWLSIACWSEVRGLDDGCNARAQLWCHASELDPRDSSVARNRDVAVHLASQRRIGGERAHVAIAQPRSEPSHDAIGIADSGGWRTRSRGWRWWRRLDAARGNRIGRLGRSDGSSGRWSRARGDSGNTRDDRRRWPRRGFLVASHVRRSQDEEETRTALQQPVHRRRIASAKSSHQVTARPSPSPHPHAHRTVRPRTVPVPVPVAVPAPVPVPVSVPVPAPAPHPSPFPSPLFAQVLGRMSLRSPTGCAMSAWWRALVTATYIARREAGLSG